MGALIEISASIILSKARVILAAGGILVLLSTIVFAAGLENDLSKTIVGLFTGPPYVTYLSFGFWLALTGAIVMLAASMKKPKAIAPQLFLPPPPLTRNEETKFSVPRNI